MFPIMDRYVMGERRIGTPMGRKENLLGFVSGCCFEWIIAVYNMLAPYALFSKFSVGTIVGGIYKLMSSSYA